MRYQSDFFTNFHGFLCSLRNIDKNIGSNLTKINPLMRQLILTNEEKTTFSFMILDAPSSVNMIDTEINIFFP